MKIHKLITTTEALADLCGRLAKADFVCVDTEFMRESTYWPELSDPDRRRQGSRRHRPQGERAGPVAAARPAGGQ
jgi:hypothetical protein